MVGILFLHFQRASITKYISYGHNRLPRKQVNKIIKEIDTAGNFNQETFIRWRDLMSEHNSIVERGERMMLLQYRAKNIKFRCLDLFMLQMQSRFMAKLLDDFSSFGERVLQLIQDSPASLYWTLGGHILMERTSWSRLCSQMMTLLHVLGMADPSSARLRLRTWPDRELLEAAAARARGIFGRFARADTAKPTLRDLLFPANARGGFESATTTPLGRAEKRRREDSAAEMELPHPAAADADGSGGREAADAASPACRGLGSTAHAMGTTRAREEGSSLQRSASPCSGAPRCDDSVQLGLAGTVLESSTVRERRS
jgi:hypothetical protein